MAEYISRDWLLTHTHTGMDTIQMMQTMIDAPAADVAPVVRCRDCRYYLYSNERCELIDTRLHFYETRNRWTDDDFCAWGERKGGDE